VDDQSLRAVASTNQVSFHDAVAMPYRLFTRRSSRQSARSGVTAALFASKTPGTARPRVYRLLVRDRLSRRLPPKWPPRSQPPRSGKAAVSRKSELVSREKTFASPNAPVASTSSLPMVPAWYVRLRFSSNQSVPERTMPVSHGASS
jgi:hypothetical protein